MKDIAYLAWRYLLFNRGKTLVLVAAITVIVFLPLALELVLDRSSERLRARAAATPLLLGARASPLELTLSSLYFDADVSATIPYRTVTDVIDSGLADAIPISGGFRVGGHPVVGTSPDYFEFRKLPLARGRLFALTGEAVLGEAASRSLGAGPGDSLVTAPRTVFDVAGSYPIKLSVVGVLASSNSPDDEAVFVDIRTGWLIAGIGHGHQDLTEPEAGAAILRRDGETIVANASVVQYREIDSSNLDDFHFHGTPADFPISAIIAAPTDQRAAVLLEGRYQGPESPVQAVVPTLVMDDLLATVFAIRQYVLAAVGVVAIATLATIALVFGLSIRLRRGEIDTMVRIGAAPNRIAAILAAEVLLVLAFSGALAGLLTGLAANWGEWALRWILSAGV